MEYRNVTILLRLAFVFLDKGTETFVQKEKMHKSSVPDRTFPPAPKEDILGITGGEELIVGEYLTAPKYGNMFHVGAYYWLATAYSSHTLWYVDYYGNGTNGGTREFGVRPVVSLKSTVKVKGRNAGGVWNIEM